MKVQVCKKKLSKVVGRMEKYAEDQGACGWRKAGGKFRENLDKLWDIGASDAIEQIQTTLLP